MHSDFSQRSSHPKHSRSTSTKYHQIGTSRTVVSSIKTSKCSKRNFDIEIISMLELDQSSGIFRVLVGVRCEMLRFGIRDLGLSSIIRLATSDLGPHYIWRLGAWSQLSWIYFLLVWAMARETDGALLQGLNRLHTLLLCSMGLGS